MNREYHYQCLQCEYHVRVSIPFNENHNHDKYKHSNSSNQLRITDFTKQDLNLSHQFQLNSALLSVVTRTSLYSLTKPNAQDISIKWLIWVLNINKNIHLLNLYHPILLIFQQRTSQRSKRILCFNYLINVYHSSINVNSLFIYLINVYLNPLINKCEFFIYAIAFVANIYEDKFPRFEELIEYIYDYFIA